MPAQSVSASQTAQTTHLPVTLHRLLPVWLKMAILVLLVASSRLYAAPPTMELFAAGGSTTATGPSTSAQTNTYAFNPDNPSGTTASSTYYPKTAVTYTIENQQYTGTLANTGLVFGGDNNTIYIPLSGQGSPATTDFTSSRLNTAAGTGIDINSNYGTRFLLRAGRLDNNSTHNTSTVNAGLGHYFGDIVVSWNRPVFNPIINISGLGGTSGDLGFAAQFQLSSPPAGTSISQLSGRNMAVSGFNITNTAGKIGATADTGGSSGSIQVLNNSPITSLRFRVYVRSDSTTNSTDWGSSTAADAFVFSASSVDSTVGDLYVSKTNNTTLLVQGGSTTYTVRATNAGPSSITTPVLKDSSGTGLTATAVACSSASGNKCTTAPTLASLSSGMTIASLASGEFYEILLTSNVTASSGNVTNTATIELPNFASSTGASCVSSENITRSYNTTTGACTSTDTDSITSATNLAIEKTGTSSVTQGNAVSYSIKVWNQGPATASSSIFTDSVPTALTNVSWSCSASGSAVCGTASGSGNAISVTTGALPVNASSTAPATGSYLTFTVKATANTVATINNTATIAAATGADPVSSNNSSTASTTVNVPAAVVADPPQKEARFVITPDLPTIYRGQTGTQLINITNQGPDNATGSVATFKPRTPAGVTVTAVKVAGGSSCSLSSGAWSCPVGSVANGGSFQLQVSYDTTTSAPLGTAIQADIRVNSNEFNPGSGVGESLYKVWGSTNPNGNTPLNEIRPNGAFALAYATANASESVNLSSAWLPSQANPTGAYLSQAAIGANNSVFGPTGTYNPTISRIITSLNSDTVAKSQTLLALDAATQAGDNRRVWELTTGIYVPASSTASLCIGNAGNQLDDGAYIMLNGSPVGADGKWSSSPFIQNSVTLNPGYNRITYRIANRNTPGNNEDYAQGLYGEIGLSINGAACTAASLDATASLQIPASINIVEKQLVTIAGQVFEDNSGTTAINSNAYNGVKNTGEAGIAGSSVSITNCNSTTVATSTSNANGEYSLSLAPAQVPAGSFCIAQTNLTGYASVSGTAGYNRATDSITVSNSGASNYSNHDFGDARINALLSEDGQQTIAAGGVAEYPHRLTAQTVLNINSLNQTSSQQPASTTEQNWQAMIYRDSNCNGRVDSGESLFSQSLPLTLKNAEEVCLVQRVYAPATASMGAQHIGQLQASFSVTLADASQITGSSLQRQDTTLLGSAGLSMQKGVRSVASCPSSAADTAGFKVQNQAQSGSYLEYEITYRNNSSRNLVNVSIKDSVPTGTVYQSTACISTPSGSCNASHLNGALLWQTGGTLLPSQQGTVRFCVQVP